MVLTRPEEHDVHVVVEPAQVKQFESHAKQIEPLSIVKLISHSFSHVFVLRSKNNEVFQLVQLVVDPEHSLQLELHESQLKVVSF